MTELHKEPTFTDEEMFTMVKYLLDEFLYGVFPGVEILWDEQDEPSNIKVPDEYRAQVREVVGVVERALAQYGYYMSFEIPEEMLNVPTTNDGGPVQHYQEGWEDRVEYSN